MKAGAKRFWASGFLWISLTLLARPLTAAEWTGFVAGIEGDWSFVGSKDRVTFGTKVDQKKSVQYDGKDPASGSISILACGHRVTFACNDPKSLPDTSNIGCVRPISLDSVSDRLRSEPAKPNALWDLITSFIASKPANLITPASRGADDVVDAVIEKKGSALIVGPSLRRLFEGEYRLEFQTLDPGTLAVGANVTTVNLHWDPETKPSVDQFTQPPGFYQLRATRKDGADAGVAWVLVADSQGYPAKSESFKMISDETKSWGASIPPSSLQAIRRAALDRLVSQAQ